MHKNIITRLIIGVLCTAMWTMSVQAMDEYFLPLMPKSPVLDGKLNKGEWDSACGFDGFVWQGKIEERSVRAYVGATESSIYVAVESELPSEGHILAKVNKDNTKVVFDDAVELFIDPNPGQERSQEFQMLVNSMGRVAYVVIPRGGAPELKKWNGDYEIKNGFTDTHWIIEIRIPLAKIAPGRKATNGVWGISVCRDWKQPWKFSSTAASFRSAGTRFKFVKAGSLAVQHRHLSDPFTRDIHMQTVLYNPGHKPLTVKSFLELKPNTMPAIVKESEITVLPGKTEIHQFKHKEQSSTGFELALKVTSVDSNNVYYNRSYAWGKPREQRWDTVKIILRPLDFKFSHYPYQKKLRILADVSGLPEDAKLESVTFTIRKKDTAMVLKTVVFEKFKNRTHEKILDMPELEGTYEIAMIGKGKNVPKEPLVKTFERKRYKWEHNKLGKSTTIYPPFTAIKVKGKALNTVLRKHELNDLGLLEKVTAGQKGREKQIMAGPMTFKVKIDGEIVPVNSNKLEFRKKSDHQVVTESSFSARALKCQARGTWEYDGALKYELTLQPSDGKIVNELFLEIPLKAELANMIHAMGDGIRNTVYDYLPSGEGVIWDAKKVTCNDLPEGFCSYIFLGSPLRGLCWFAENDLGWSWDRETPNLEVIRKGNIILLRVHLVNKPIVIKAARRITFGLMAAPVKPRIGQWRHQWKTDKYSLLGTDINWLGGPGLASNVYPVNKDMYYWKMIARGNVEKLPKGEIEECVQRGKAYIKTLGYTFGARQTKEQGIKRWTRHVRFNLGGSRYQKTMVFYYNRGIYNAADEFPTFMNEWVRPDYYPYNYKPSAGIVMIIPSESYNDYALYWYNESFKYGRNRGVYWDNWYFMGDYNRVMTDAYADDKGQITPATGVWAMRELAKRTFVMMCEKKMLPIVMPHMTSTNILPMHSFATVQYDWEWKYSRGDVQYRHTRPYTMLVSNGELAGVWPVMLDEHGPQVKDEWVQRTFCGVCLIHELVSSGKGKAWKTLRDPLIPLMKDDKLKVYRYWDEKPQPVSSGNKDLPLIVYSIPGKVAMAILCSYSEKDEDVLLTIKPQFLGFPKECKVSNLETNESFTMNRNKIQLRVKKHEVIGFRIESN